MFFVLFFSTESPTSESINSSAINERQSEEEPKKKINKKPSPIASADVSKSPLKTQTIKKKPTSRISSRSSSPGGQIESQIPSRRYSAVNDANSCRRKSNKENEVRKTPRSRSATPGRYNSVETPLPPQNAKSASENKFGTWNGKGKKRPGINSDGYSPSNFVRNSVGRSSLGSHSLPGGVKRIMQKSGESKNNMSPLLADLLKTKNLNDDKTILLKMKEIINQYSGIFEESSSSSSSPDKKSDSNSDDLDFTSEWVKNNGSLRKMENCSGDYNEKSSSPNKRKDVKYDGSQSKIPAPVFFKQQQQQPQHVSEKEY